MVDLQSLLRFPRGVANWSLQWILSPSALLKRPLMTAPNPRIARRSHSLKHQMYLSPQGDATGWTQDCVLDCELEAVVSTTISLTVPLPTQSVSALKTCCPMHQIIPRMNLLSSSTVQVLPRNNFYRLNLPMTTTCQYSPNMGLSKKYLKLKKFPRQQQKLEYH